jgi:DNA (cytosine-5)-methyltransferase 1
VTFQVLSLFAGIGGFDLGLERTGGFKTVAFCEIDKKAQPFFANTGRRCQSTMTSTSLTAERLASDGVAPDCIVGGFPCQDISTAGLGAGIEGERSGLWAEYSRLIGELRPLYVIVENVSALLSRGLDKVLGDLAALGYDAWWDCIPASAVGAPHRRDRIWIVANASGGRLREPGGGQVEQPGRTKTLCPGPASDATSNGRQQGQPHTIRSAARAGEGEEHRSGNGGGDLADAECRYGKAQHEKGILGQSHSQGPSVRLADGYVPADRQWLVEPNVGRVADGVPGRVDRLKQLGNAVVPQIPELIGRAILAAEAA